MTTMNEAKTEAIANADAHTNNANLPTYSELLAFVQKARTAAGLMASSSSAMPEFGRDAAALLARIAG